MSCRFDDQKKRWEEQTVAPLLEKYPEQRKSFETASGIPVERVYGPGEDCPGFEEKIGFPGEYPFTRGVQPTMYRGRFWTMRQYAGFGTAEESNRRYRYLLSQGQTGLSVAFDLPTQIGLDSDDPLSAGEVGKVGVAIDSLDDMEILFDKIPLDKVSTSMTINAPAAVLLAMYICVGRKQGVSADRLRGINVRIENTRASYDALKAHYELLKSEHQEQRASFTNDVEAYNARVRNLNAAQRAASSRGTPFCDTSRHLDEERAALDLAHEDLKQRRGKPRRHPRDLEQHARGDQRDGREPESRGRQLQHHRKRAGRRVQRGMLRGARRQEEHIHIPFQ